jgi:signal transduction histidine kinase
MWPALPRAPVGRFDVRQTACRARRSGSPTSGERQVHHQSEDDRQEERAGDDGAEPQAAVTGRPGEVVTAEGEAGDRHRRSSADTPLLGSLALDAVMLACTYVLTRLAVRRALRPVRTMTDQADQAGQWSAVASEERFGSMRHPAELARLGASLDAIPDRIRTLLRHERQLTGELSHELRTPLSRIIAQLDWWRPRPRTAHQTHACHQVIAEAAESMRTICDTLLADARDRTLSAPGTAQMLPTLRRPAEVLCVPGHLTVTVDGPGLVAGVPSALLERIVSPLLANACRYARSGVGLHVHRTPDGVADDGTGVPTSFAGQLFEPADGRIPATATAVRASACHWPDAWPAAPAAT